MAPNLDESARSDKANHPDSAETPQDIPSDWRAVRDVMAKELPVFPISLTPKAGGGTEKKPLTPNGHKDATRDVASFGNLWSKAQGFGLPMGEINRYQGLYAFDLDTYKPGSENIMGWLKRWGCLTGTREHKTVSGGTHLIYMLPAGYLNLPSRANIVPGLDSRGQGGWVAFGEGYEVVNPALPHLLHSDTCEEIKRGYKGGGPGSTVDIGAYQPPENTSGLAEKYRRACLMNAMLTKRHAGIKTGGDASRSARDHSVAFLLAVLGFETDEIAYCLMNLFPHGVGGDPTLSTNLKERASQRSAVKATAYVEEQSASLSLNFKNTNEISMKDYLMMIGAQADGHP